MPNPNTAVRCPNGHFFDILKFQVCPYCGAPAAGPEPQFQQMRQAVPPMQQPVQPVPPMQPFQPMPQPFPPIPPMPPQPGYFPPAGMPQNYPVTGEKAVSAPDAADDMNKNPTVGWLVCIKGPSFGKTYPIRENKNFVGRAATMDIRIEGDNSVSREKHGIITYVPKQRIFFAMPGESRELFYVNDKVVLENMELHPNDKLEFGKSLFLFVPLCGEKFSWDDIN